jgi:hypothetical protein
MWVIEFSGNYPEIVALYRSRVDSNDAQLCHAHSERHKIH